MLVKKKNPNWFPSENKSLAVGETVELTDPKQLVLNGDVTPLASDGITEVSAYELYGVIVADERKDFEEYLKHKKAEEQKKALEAQQKALEAEKAALKEDLKKVEKAEEPKEEVKN